MDKLQVYLKYLKSKNYSENTVKMYDSQIRNFIFFMKKNNASMEELNYQTYMNYFLEYEKLSPSTRNFRISCINNYVDFINLVFRKEYMRVPAKFLKVKNISNVEPLTITDEKRIIDEIESYQRHIRIAILIMLTSGLRLSEVTKLKKKDVIEIDRKMFFNVRDTKRNKERIVPIFSKKLYELIEDSTNKDRESSVVLVGNRAIQYNCTKIENDTGVRFYPHLARHTFATRKLNEGMRIDVLQKIMGHSYINTTMLYAKTYIDEIIKYGVEK